MTNELSSRHILRWRLARVKATVETHKLTHSHVETSTNDWRRESSYVWVQKRRISSEHLQRKKIFERKYVDSVHQELIKMLKWKEKWFGDFIAASFASNVLIIGFVPMYLFVHFDFLHICIYMLYTILIWIETPKKKSFLFNCKFMNEIVIETKKKPWANMRTSSC